MKYTLHIFLVCALLVACKQNTTKQQKADTTPQATTKVTGQKVQDFVLEGHEILAQQEGDLNGDGKAFTLRGFEIDRDIEIH